MASSRYKLMRYKFIDLPVGKNEITLNFYAHNEGYVKKIAEKEVIVLPMKSCDADDYKYIKYLSTDGKYKFIPFQKYFTMTQQDESLGETTKFSTNLKTAQGDTYSLGTKTEKQLVLTTSCTQEQYEEWSKVFQSPRVYLQLKDPTLYDEDENWLLVKVEGGNQYSTKKTRTTFSLTVKLPSYNNITM